MKLQKLFERVLLSIVLTSASHSTSFANTSTLELPICSAVFLNASSARADVRPFENVKKYDPLYTKGRGVETYSLILGKDFAQKLAKTAQDPDGHWFDSGAGEAIAVRQTLKESQNKLSATVVALETFAKSNDRLKVISGRFLENIADSEIPKSDLITDVFGPLAYSGQPHLVVDKYVKNLKSHGEIYIFMGQREELYGQNNQVLGADGKAYSLAEWLQTIPGLSTEILKIKVNDDGTIFERWTLKITKDREDIQIPAVEMIHFKEGAPPQMTFREVGANAENQRLSLQEKAAKFFAEKNKNITAAQFLDSFRGGAVTHPLLASIKSLNAKDQWINFTQVGENILRGLQSREFDFTDTKTVFTSLAQKFISWRAKGINANKLNYSPLKDSKSIEDIHDVKLISDFYGDFVSSYAPDVVLNRYVNALSNKGEIYLYTGQEFGGFGTESYVMTKAGVKQPLRQWLQSIPGLYVKLYRGGYHWTGGEWTFLKITISNRQSVKIPRLKLVAVGKDTSDGIPVPIFEEAP